MSAAQVPAAVQQQPSYAAGQMAQQQFAPISGQQQATLPQQPTTDSTLQVLMDVAAPVLGPMIQKARTDAFVSGMQRAAAGETIRQIAEERPWFSKVFGDGDAVAGARVYETNARASSVAAGLISGMEDYAKLDAVQFRDHVSKAMQQALTGDAETDASVLQASARSLPQVFAAHTQASIRYGRVRAAEAQVNNIMSAAQLYGATVSSNAVEVSQQAQQAFLSTLEKPPGQGDDEHAAAVEGSVRLLAEQGNMHAAWAAVDSPQATVLTPAQRARLTNTIITNERQLMRMPVSEPFHGQVQELFTLRLGSKLEEFGDEAKAVSWLNGQVQALNDQWRKTTGSRQPFIGVSDSVRAQTQIHGYFKEMQREAVRDARERAKLLAGAQLDLHEQTTVARAVLSGGIIPAAVEVHKRHAREAAVYKEHLYPMLQQTGPLDDAASAKLDNIVTYAVASGSSFEEPAAWLTAQYQAAVQGGKLDTGKMVQVYNAAARLHRAGMSTSAMFTDATVAARMQRVLSVYDGAEIKPGSQDPNVALTSLTDPSKPLPVRVTSEDRKDVVQGFRDALNGRDSKWGTFMSVVRGRGIMDRLVGDETLAPLANRLVDAAQAFASMSGLPLAEASKQVFTQLRTNGNLHSTGRHIIVDMWNTGTLQDKLLAGRSMNEADWIHADPSDEFDDAVEQFVGEGNRVIKMAGGSGGQLSITVMMENARDGNPMPVVRQTTYKALGDMMRKAPKKAESSIFTIDKSKPRTWTYGEQVKWPP